MFPCFGALVLPCCREYLGPAPPYLRPAAAGDLCTLTALRRLGVPWGVPDVVVRAVREVATPVSALRWLAGGPRCACGQQAGMR